MSSIALELDDELDEQEDDPIAARWREKQQASQSAEVVPHTEYRNDPVGWARDKMQIPEYTLRWSLLPEYAGHKWDGTFDPLATALEALAAGNNVVMESGTGLGKTFCFAVGGLWFDACWEDANVRTHAPKQDQLTQHLWKEMSGLWPRFQRHFPSAHLGFLRVQMRPKSDKWGMVGVVAGVRAEEKEGSATKAQGAHAAHMLSIIEEGPGMPPPIVTAIKQTSRGDHNLIWAGGNPDHQLDELHKLVEVPGFVHVIISGLDHPNYVCRRDVIPGATSYSGVIAAGKEYGTDSPFYNSRVRGISPRQSTEALIKYDWLEAAAERWESRDKMAVEKLPGAKGVDAAQSKNGDKAAIATFRGEYLMDLRAFHCDNVNKLGRDVVAECRRENIPLRNVAVDSVGLGSGAYNELYDVDPSAFSFQGGPIKGAMRGNESSEWIPDANQFFSLRCQAWWALREDLRLGRIHMPKHEALWKQLLNVTYKRDRQKVVVESKEDIRKRTQGGASPDEADAVVYGNFVRPREIRVVAQVVPIDPTRDIGAQPSEYQQQFSEELQYAAPDEIGAFSQFPW